MRNKKDELVMSRLDYYAGDFEEGWLDRVYEAMEVLDDETAVVEMGVYGGLCKDYFEVVEGVKYSATIKIFADGKAMGEYLTRERMVHGGEFLHKDFENPLSVFHPSFEKRNLKRRKI